MCRQAIRLAGLEGVQEQARQDEVVRPVAVAGQPFVGRIVVVDLREHDQPERIGHPADPIQELVDLRLDHEAGRAGLLDDIPDGVEPNHANAVIGERSQPTGDQRPRRLARDIEVDLLRPVGRPERRPDVLLLPGVLDGDGRERTLRLAKKISAISSPGGSPAGHTLSRVTKRSAWRERRP